MNRVWLNNIVLHGVTGIPGVVCCKSKRHRIKRSSVLEYSVFYFVQSIYVSFKASSQILRTFFLTIDKIELT